MVRFVKKPGTNRVGDFRPAWLTGQQYPMAPLSEKGRETLGLSGLAATLHPFKGNE